MATTPDVHYCGHQHPAGRPCPSPEWEPGGVPLSEIPPCSCTSIDHAPTCRRRWRIVLLEIQHRRP